MKLPNELKCLLQSFKEHAPSLFAEIDVFACFEWFLKSILKAIVYIKELANYVWACVLLRVDAFLEVTEDFRDLCVFFFVLLTKPIE